MVIDAKVIDCQSQKHSPSQFSNWYSLVSSLVNWSASLQVHHSHLGLILNLLHLQRYVYSYKRNLQS